MRGVIIAGTHSGCGKTTATLGIMAALRKKGLAVQPFKTGPDFIDAGLHRLAAGRRSRNLDQWMCGRDYVVACFQKHARASDISVIEGVMGMYDGEFNTASLARLLDVPVILVVDGYGMAESAGAMVYGFTEFGKNSPNPDNPPNPALTKWGERGLLAGVIFNRVASESHYKRLKDSVRNVSVLGYLPRELNFEIPHRHLGLATAEENPISDENIDRLADTVIRYIDLDMLIEPANRMTGKREDNPVQSSCRIPHSVFRIAVAYDKAFCFYYEDNLDMLREAGAEIVQFSPLTDRTLPAGVDAVYIGGGYPELHAKELSRNTSMLASLRAWSEAGRPLYAECGGLMYLSRGIRDLDAGSHAMGGVFPFETRMLRKPRLAYREIVLKEDCILGTSGEGLRGHEFHYSEILDGGQSGDQVRSTKIYTVRDRNGVEAAPEGFRIGNTLASYIHVHFGSNPNIAKRFVRNIVR